MEKYEVELLPAAYADLDEIFDFILADSPPAADRILEKSWNPYVVWKNYRFQGHR